MLGNRNVDATPQYGQQATMAPETKTVRLSRPLETHQGPVHEILLTEASGALVMQYGLPFTMKQSSSPDGVTSADIEFKYEVMSKYLVQMTGHDQIILGSMSAMDMMNCMIAVLEMMAPAGNLPSRPTS